MFTIFLNTTYSHTQYKLYFCQNYQLTKKSIIRLLSKVLKETDIGEKIEI